MFLDSFTKIKIYFEHKAVTFAHIFTYGKTFISPISIKDFVQGNFLFFLVIQLHKLLYNTKRKTEAKRKFYYCYFLKHCFFFKGGQLS